MSTPNPLIPQGTFQAAAGKGASNVRIAVATIVAIHVVFFGGLLLQGCKKDNQTAINMAKETNSLAATNYTLPPINSDNLYSNATRTADATGQTGSIPAPPSSTFADTVGSSTTNAGNIATRDPWKANNLGATGTTTAQDQTPGATKEYTVVAHDTFKKIATANGITVAALEKANPNIDPKKLRPNMKLVIPAAAAAPVKTAGSTAAPAGDASGAAPAGDVYTVKQGDTLTKIAKAHHVTTSELRAANSLKTADIRPNQKLKIPAPLATGSTNTTTSTKHKKSSTNTTHSTTGTIPPPPAQ